MDKEFIFRCSQCYREWDVLDLYEGQFGVLYCPTCNIPIGRFGIYKGMEIRKADEN